MKTFIKLGIVLIAATFGSAVSGAEATTELRTVQAKSLSLQVPVQWEQVATTSEMRAAQFAIAGGEGQSADLTVFHFGGPTGGVKANVERWIGQFEEKNRKLTMSQGKCDAGRYIIVDAIGTWNKPDGPPFARKTIATPDSRVVNVIVIEEKNNEEDYYFLKLSGKEDIVSSQIDALRKAIGVDDASEKPFALKDAPN
tara:strand:- start:24462 stop:25055 length:594 start_codon:yes stop_codon:yes gene_type:complete